MLVDSGEEDQNTDRTRGLGIKRIEKRLKHRPSTVA